MLQQVEQRDQDTWGFYLLESPAQGLAPERTITDAAPGLKASYEEGFGKSVPCDGDVFHIQHQCQGVANSLSRQAMGATSLQAKMAVAKQKGQGNRFSKKLTEARSQEAHTIALARDVKTLIGWLNHDVLELSGAPFAERQELPGKANLTGLLAGMG